MFAVYISHPQVLIEPAVPVHRWGLSDLGAARVRNLAAQPWIKSLTRVISSDETKAIETAMPIAAVAGLTVEIGAAMHENDRSATGYLPPPAFEAAADAFFAEPHVSFRGWETAAAAQARILAAVTAALQDHPADRPVAFVGHGAVGSLLWLALAGQAITRAADQPAGGGNLFAFRLVDRRPLCAWTAMERWQPPA